MKAFLSNTYRFIRMFIRLWHHHQISLRAAALTYALILAIIPLFAVALSGGSLFIKGRDLNSMLMPFLVQNLAPGSAAKVGNLINTLLAKVHFRAMGYVGFGALLFTCLLLLSSIENSINRIWSIRKKKDLWKRVVIYNLLLVLGPASVSFSLSTITFLGHMFPKYVAKANIGVFVVNALLFSFVYKIFPNKRVNWVATFAGGTAAAAAAELAKYGYTIYTAKAFFYNEVYGGLAVLPLFLIWVYVNWNIFLGGALLTYMI
ncbi:MAG: YihY/virulence factor BrkB family protein, partial [Bdellovibrionota bacterium]